MRQETAIGAVLVMLLGAGSAAAQDKPTVTIGMLGGQLGATVRTLYEPWEKQKNVAIRWVSNSSSAETVAKLQAQKAKPEIDVAFGDNITHFMGSQHGLWEALDPAIVTNLRDVQPRAVTSTPGGVGFGFFYSGLVYRADEFEKNGWKPPASWSDLFRPELCGRVGVQPATSTYTIHMLLMLADGDPARIPGGIEKIAQNKRCIPVLEPVNKLEEKMQIGEYVIGVHGQIRAIPLQQKGVPVRFVNPKEGSVVSFSTASVVKNAPAPKLAQEFVNWLLEPSVQTALMKELFYGPANVKVEIPADLKAAGVPDAAAIDKMVSVSEQIVNDQRRDWGRLLERAMAR